MSFAHTKESHKSVLSTFTGTHCIISDPDPVSNTISLVPLCNHNTLQWASIGIFLEVNTFFSISGFQMIKKLICE